MPPACAGSVPASCTARGTVVKTGNPALCWLHLHRATSLIGETRDVCEETDPASHSGTAVALHDARPCGKVPALRREVSQHTRCACVCVSAMLILPG